MSDTLGKVRNPKVRNLLRGLLSKTIEDTTQKTYHNLRKIPLGSDVDEVIRLLHDSNLFRHIPVANPFPSQPISRTSMYDSRGIPIECEIAFQIARINYYREEITLLLKRISALNSIIVEKIYPKAVDLINNIISEFGYSIFILNKTSYIYSQQDVDSETKERCRSVIESYGLSLRNILPLSAVDLMGDSYEYFPVRNKLYDWVNSNPSKFMPSIISWQIQPIIPDGIKQAEVLHALGDYSLIDACIFICVYNLNLNSVYSDKTSPSYTDLLSDDVKSAWTRMSAQTLPQPTVPHEEFLDLRFFRQSMAFIELSDVSIFRSSLDHLYLAGYQVTKSRVSHISQHENGYFGHLSYSDLLQRPSSYKLSLRCADIKTAPFLTRTALFARCVRRGDDISQMADDDLLYIMGTTENISNVLTVDELACLRDKSRNTNIHKLVFSILYNQRISTVKSDNIVRNILQDILLGFGNDIIVLLNWIYRRAPNVAEYLCHACTEDMMIQMFRAFSTPSEAYENRARVLEWLGEKLDQPAALERATMLRRDMRLRRVRGEIDDTRVYIDTHRFTQWLQDNVLEDISAIFRAPLINEDDIDKIADISSYQSLSLPHIRLASVLQRSFSEFCSNKAYGIDSYLGRRIRHGTLKGHMTEGLREIMAREEFALVIDHPVVGPRLEAWVASFQKNVDIWAEEYFQIRSKQKPRGAFSTDIISAQKIDVFRRVMKDIVRSIPDNPVYIQVLNFITERCWYFLEPDLHAVRGQILAARPNWGVIDRDSISRGIHGEAVACIYQLCREVNHYTSDRFQSVSRWFSRPSILVPSARLNDLFIAVLDEVQEYVPKYNPNVIAQNGQDIQVIGAYYHNLYDILYIIIHNAALHGDANGTLKEVINVADAGDRFEVDIEISNDLDPNTSEEITKDTLAQLFGNDDENALINHGSSGIKKLRKMANELKEVSSLEIGCEDRVVFVRFHLSLDRS